LYYYISFERSLKRKFKTGNIFGKTFLKIFRAISEKIDCSFLKSKPEKGFRSNFMKIS